MRIAELLRKLRPMESIDIVALSDAYEIEYRVSGTLRARGDITHEVLSPRLNAEPAAIDAVIAQRIHELLRIGREVGP